MTKDEYSQLLKEIAGGGDEVGAEAGRLRAECEARVSEKILTNYWGTIVAGNAIHQFYMDLLPFCGKRLDKATPLVVWFFHWHVLSLARYFAAFDLFKRGYYFESSSLARTLWETALTLCALKRGVVTIEDVLGGNSTVGQEVNEKEMKNRVKETDRRIQNALIWKNTDLTDKARKAVNSYLGLVNLATHKSSLGLAMNVKLLQRGEPINLLPTFHAKRTEVSSNILHIATWCLMTTLSYMQGLMPESGSDLDLRYQKVLLSFEELNKLPPNALLLGIGELPNKVFLGISGSTSESPDPSTRPMRPRTG